MQRDWLAVEIEELFDAALVKKIDMESLDTRSCALGTGGATSVRR